MLWNFFIWEEDMAAAGVEACGMFSPTHLIATVICLALLFFCVVRSRGFSEKKLDRIAFFAAIVTTALELGKITFNLVHGGFTPNHWLPLTFCSFAIFSYWMLAFGRGFIHDIAKGYICGGGIIAGLTFLVVPMTSVATYPMFHYLSCYSMIFHSLMMYVGFSYLLNGYFRLDMKGYRRFLAFTVPAVALALAVNLVYALFDDLTNCNMMFLSHPYRLTSFAPFIGTVYDIPVIGAPIYTLGACAVYLTIPFFLPYGMARLADLVRVKKKKDTPVAEPAQEKNPV